MSVNVIKVRANNGALGVSKITRETHEASLDAKDILAKAQEQAAQLIEDAQREKEALLAESAERGYAAGLDKWNDALAEAWKQREQFFTRNEAELVKLAVAVAEKIIGRTVQTDPSTVLQTVSEALKSVRSERRITVKVNPAEEAALREQAGALKMLCAQVGDLVIVGNPSIAMGGCIVESELGMIDAQISTQLASIEKALMRRFDAGNR
jgi:type III secretion system HrpE/YscL family protein